MHVPSTKTSAWLLLMAAAVLVSLTGFVCGPVAVDCLAHGDCASRQLCGTYRCQALSSFPCQTDRDCRASQRCRNQRCEERPPPCTPTPETCDGKDNDCDGKIDEGCPSGVGLYGWCNAKQPCQKGLVCHRDMCHRPCDPTQGETNNPDCDEPGKEKCYALSASEGVCKVRCVLSQGSFGNPVCPAGTYCLAKLDHCIPTASPRFGTRGVGESCAVDPAQEALHCDGAKNLSCVAGECERNCVLGASPSLCVAGQRCIGSFESFTGGYCK